MKIIARKEIKLRSLLIALIVLIIIFYTVFKLYLFYRYSVDTANVYQKIRQSDFETPTNTFTNINDSYEESIDLMLTQYGFKKKIVRLKIHYYFLKYQDTKNIKLLYKIISWATFYLEYFNIGKRDSDIFYFIGKSYFQLGDSYAQSYSIPFLKLYLKKKKSNNLFEDIYVMLYSLYYEQGDYEKAKKNVELAIQNFDSNDIYLHLLHIKACYKLGLNDKVQSKAFKILLNKNIKYDSNVKEIGLVLVRLLEKLSLEEKAISIYERLLEISVRDYDIAYQYGKYLINIDKVKKARSHFYSLYLETKDKRYYDLFLSARKKR